MRGDEFLMKQLNEPVGDVVPASVCHLAPRCSRILDRSPLSGWYVYRRGGGRAHGGTRGIGAQAPPCGNGRPDQVPGFIRQVARALRASTDARQVHCVLGRLRSPRTGQLASRAPALGAIRRCQRPRLLWQARAPSNAMDPLPRLSVSSGRRDLVHDRVPTRYRAAAADGSTARLGRSGGCWWRIGGGCDLRAVARHRPTDGEVRP